MSARRCCSSRRRHDEQQARAGDLRRRRAMRAMARPAASSTTTCCSICAPRGLPKHGRREPLACRPFSARRWRSSRTKPSATRWIAHRGRGCRLGVDDAPGMTAMDSDDERTSYAALRRRGDPGASFRSCRSEVYGKPLVYLDNAASAQKPRAVIDAHGACRWSTTTPTCIAACTTSPTRRRKPSRTRASRCAASSTPSSRRRDHLHASRRPRPINLVADPLRPHGDRGGRRDRPLDHGAPLQHRALALPPRAQGRGDEIGAGGRRGRFLLDEFEALLAADARSSPSRTCPTSSAP